MRDDITQAIISGKHLELSRAIKRQPPDPVREELAALDPVTRTRFVAGRIDAWRRLRAALAAANQALDIDSAF